MSQLLKNIKSTVIKAQQGAQTNQAAPARSLSATSAGQQVKQGMQQGQQQVKPVQRKIPAIGRTSSQKSPFTSQRITSNVQKIEYIRPKTSYQQLRAVAEPQKKWYKGDMPTVSEAAARIYTISQTAPEEGQRLYGELMRFQSDPSTPFYNPYATATNKAVQELAALGFDMSGGVTEDWLAQNSWLKNYYRTTGASNTPQAPTKSSSAEQNAAYWYYKLLSAQETTDKANAEWEALKEEVGYWANRTDRNYSDEEILKKIDWSNYGTLVRMDEGRDNGVPLTLNSANGYSQDALKGVIWAARNGSTGDALADSAKAVLGAGKSWAENKTLRAKLDPASESYSPYSAGSTLDDAALYFGVQSFGKDWLEKNRELLSGDDATAKKMYQAVYNAEQTTQKAEAELADLRASIDRYMQTTSDPDAIMRMIDGEYATLESMDESLKTGKLLGTTRAVDYRRQDIEAEVRRRCLEKNTQVEVPEFVVTLRRLLGLPAMSTESGTAVDASRDNAINAGGATIADAGTQEEKVVFGTAYSSNFDAYLTQIKDAMDSGIDNPQAGYDYTLERATKYAAENYIDARSTIENYEAAQDARDEAVKRLAEMGIVYDEDGNLDMTNRKSALPELTGTASASAGTGDAPRKLRKASDDTADEIDMLRKEIASGYGKDEKGKRVKLTDAELDAKKSELQALIHPETVSASQKEINTLLDVIDESEETLADTQKAYDKAVKTMRNIEDGYAVASRMQQLTGAKSGDERSTLAQMDYLFAIGKDYEPTQWRSANLYATAMDEYGATYEQTAAAAKQGMAQNKKQIEQIDFALSELEAKGAHLPEAYAENIARCRAALVRDVQDAEYFLVRENKDYYSETRSVSEAVFAAWKDYNELNPLGMLKNVFSDRGGYSALDNAVAIRLEQLEMEEASAALGQDLKSDKVIMASGNPNQDGYYSEDISQLNKNECMTYLYLRGKEGDAAAKAYYDHLSNSEYGVINMRRNLDLTEKAAAFADENALTGTLASVLSVIASPLNIGGLVESVKADLSGKEMNPYARGFVYGSMNSTARGTVKENIVNSVDNEAAGWLLGAGYDALMSYGDSMISSYFMGGLGAAAGAGAGNLLSGAGISSNYAELAAKVASSFVTASGQGMQAVGNAMMDASLRGATPEERRILGVITFLAEAATEAIEVETIDSAIHGGAEREFKNTFKKVLFNMFNEGAGEGVSELVEGIADKAIMDYKSNWAASVERYKAEGMTKQQAEDAAWKEIVWSALEAGAVGGISGAMGTGLGYLQGRMFGDGNTAQGDDAQNASAIAQDVQNTEAQNVAPADADTITAPNTAQETQTTNNEDSGKIAQQVTALTAALDADESSRTATIGAALIGENANAQATAIASAAAQHLADMLGSEEAARFTRDVLLLDSDTNGVRAALTVAALDRSGRANQVITQLAQDGVTAEGVAQLKAAADADMQNANASANIQQAAIENQVARRTAELIGDGGLKAVQPYETAVAQKRSELRQAQGDLRRQQNRREELGKNLLTLQDNINSGTATPQLLDTFRQTVKDIEGQIKVVAEYEQRVSNAEQGLQDARNQLASVRDEALRQVRQQAQKDVADMQAQQFAEQETAKAEQAATLEDPQLQDVYLAAAEEQSSLNDLLKQIHDELGLETPYESVAQKSIASMENKVKRKQAEGVEYSLLDMKDHARSRLILDNFDQANKVLDALDAREIPYQVEAVGPTRFGYRGLHVTWRTEKGLGVEVQLTTPEAWKTKLVSDSIYDKWRNVDLTQLTEKEELNYYKDIVRSLQMWNQLDLPNLSAYERASSSETGLESISSAPKSERASLPQRPSENSSMPDSLTRISRPDSVTEYNDFSMEAPPSVNNSIQLPGNTVNSEQNGSGDKYRQFGTQTAQSTDALFQETRDYLLHNSVYEADSNTEQIDRAIDWVRGQATSHDPVGYFTAKSAVLDPSFDYASADGQARMLTVMQMSTLMGDAQGQVQIADIFNRQGTALAQALQARKIFYMMSPAAQVASIQKIANNLSQENGVTVTAPQDTLDRLSQAKTMDEAQKIRNQIVKEMYQQLPANWKSRLNGLRYFAMLANPRTHIRNILGNTIMQGTAYARDEINAALERFFLPQEERTKSFKTKKEYRDAAKALYTEFSSLFDGDTGKYNPEMNRRSFNTQWLQKLADLNTNLLDKEDTIAMGSNFRHYLAGFLQARGWDVNNLTDAQKQEAVQYAFTNAEKNVYHQASKLAEWLNKLGRDKDSSVFDKLGHRVIEGVLPFKKTPINILKTGVEYSPIGLINSLTRGLYQMNQYRQTNGQKGISTAQFLQNLSSGLTGSGLMGVGALMMANGLLRVGFKDKDPEDEYARLTGSQEFSIELFGYSYTIDWTAPASIPLFMGAAMYKEIENRDEGLTWGNAFDVFMSTISATAEPMLNMTMLDGVNSTIQSVAYANATGSSVGDIIIQSLLNLSTQLVPTSLGAVARTIDPVRRKTYADKNLNIPTWLQYPWERVQNKLPGLSQLNMPYVNAWGEEDREDNLLMRIFENFLSPGYVSRTEADSVETELRDISVRTGTNLIPDLPKQNFSANGEKINLTAEQYEQYVKTRGSLMHTELERLFATDEYRAMSLGAQASCIEDIQKWADERGKMAVYPDKTLASKWMDTDNPVPSVLERRANEDKQAYQNEAYSNIQSAIDNDDAATARDWVYALNQAGVENSKIKPKMTTMYKSEYQYAIRSGDRETARKIEGVLLAMDIGYKAKDFINWEKDAYKEE